jgi:hypothetical protein
MPEEPKQMQAIFPDFPRETPVLDKHGDFNPLWSLGLSSLFQALQDNFRNEGIVFPPLTATQMKTIQDAYQPYVGGTYEQLVVNLRDISGQTVFDSTTYMTNQFVIAQDNGTPSLVTLAEWVPFAMMIMNAGNPNTSVPVNRSIAGVLNWMCYDFTNKVLYACTTAGAIGTAVWTAI